MIVYQHAQGSVDWSIARAGKVTASEMDALISPLGKIREGDGVTTYLNQKLCELWTGGPLLSLQGIFDADQGTILEERAKPAFTFHTGIEIQNVGFIATDDDRVGCSPDALIGDTSGVEIKCPRLDTHVGYLLAGKLPKQYVAQVQGSMMVTGCKTWHFFSYNRSLPPLHLIIERDEEFQEALEEAIHTFIIRLDAAYARLVEINGGLPKRPVIKSPAPIEKITDFHLTPPGTPLDGKWVVNWDNEEPMKITEQTLRELLVNPHTIAELIASKPAEVRAFPEAISFHLHVEQCQQCKAHIKALCSEGKRLLQEWAVSYLDARVN